MFKVISALILLIAMFSTQANVDKRDVIFEDVEIQILQQGLSVKKIKSKIAENKNSDQLIIWVAPGFGTHQRAMEMSAIIAKFGVEVWHVDLAESLFLPKNTHTMRALDGKYLEGLIKYAHQETNKNITLLTRSYGALPVLKALRYWQIKQANKNISESFYLQGAILFSPELYAAVPGLGLEPIFSNITKATNMPLMLFQGEKRNNRWQVKKLLDNLDQGGSATYYKLLKGVNGIFYSGDTHASTLKQVALMPKKILASMRLLNKATKPVAAVKIKVVNDKEAKPLNINLKVFKGNKRPPTINLVDVYGRQHKKMRYKGKVTVVNFWATWCPPCVEEIPSLNNLKKLIPDKNFKLISINYGEDKETIRNFMRRVNVNFPVLLDPSGKQAAKWKVLVFPSTFVIGPSGKIIYGVNAGIHWDVPTIVAELKKLLKQ